MTLRSLVAAVLFAPLVVTVAVGKVEYRLTRCVSSGDGQFAASFVGSEKQQRRIALSSERFEFGGDVKGAARLGDVQELRLSPVLEVVFTRPEHPTLYFGRLSPECRRLIRNAARRLVKVQDGEG